MAAAQRAPARRDDSQHHRAQHPLGGLQVSGPETWRAVADQISHYLSESQAAGLLAGDTSRRAFYVKCDQDTNGRGNGLSFVVGLALARPDEFVAFRFEHDVADCRVTEISDWCRSI